MPIEKLIPLDAYNESARKIAFADYKDICRPNGIACPQCGAELVDKSQEVLTSFPAQKRVKCLTCDFSGLRITQ